MNANFMADHELRGIPVTVLAGASIISEVKVIPRQ
jgi:hypothetical protein